MGQTVLWTAKTFLWCETQAVQASTASTKTWQRHVGPLALGWSRWPSLERLDSLGWPKHKQTQLEDEEFQVNWVIFNEKFQVIFKIESFSILCGHFQTFRGSEYVRPGFCPALQFVFTFLPIRRAISPLVPTAARRQSHFAAKQPLPWLVYSSSAGKTKVLCVNWTSELQRNGSSIPRTVW